MSDYKHLKQVLKILKMSSRIQKIDIRMKKFEGDAAKVAKLEAEKA